METTVKTETQNKPVAPATQGGRTVRIVQGRKGPRQGQGGVAPGKDGKGGFSKSGPRKGGGRRSDKPRSEFENKLLEIRRVVRVMGGGRRFSFAVSMVIGDKKGRVGIGTGKSSDTPLAIEKAIRDAENKLVRIPLTKEASIPHQVEAKYSSALVSIMPTKSKGITAGSAMRTVLELAGVQAVTGKILSRSKNKTNIAKASIKALLNSSISK